MPWLLAPIGKCGCPALLRPLLEGHLCSAIVTRCRLVPSRLSSWAVFAGCYLLVAAH